MMIASGNIKIKKSTQLNLKTVKSCCENNIKFYSNLTQNHCIILQNNFKIIVVDRVLSCVLRLTYRTPVSLICNH